MTQKKMGRPRSFDKKIALTAAMKVFWEKGYDGASMKDLTNAMNINSPSLYSVFGDKQTLYLSAIDNYTNNNATSPLVKFENEPNIKEAVRIFMRAALNTATVDESSALGCFLSSSVATTAGVVEGVQEKLQQAINQADAKLVTRFELEKSKGNLSPTFPSQERARLMFDLRQGYTFRARAGFPTQSMESDLDFRVNMVLSDTNRAIN